MDKERTFLAAMDTLKQSMLKKIDIIMPFSSQYAVQHHFARKLYEAFFRTNIDCRLIEDFSKYREILKNPPQLTIGFNGVPLINDQPLCDITQIPHLAYLIDPAFRFFSLTKSPHIILTCDDKSSVDLLNKLGFSRTFFLPHAVERELSFNPTTSRHYDVVLMATFIDIKHRQKGWKKNFPRSVYQAMSEAVEAGLSDTPTSFIEVLWQRLSTHAPEFLLNATLYEEVELYIKGQERIDLVKAMTDASVHIFGNDPQAWQKCFSKQRHVIIHPAVNFEEALDVMRHAKIILNCSLKNKQGAHERIFSGAACGAAIVTHDNLFLRETFVDGKEIVFYQRKNFAAMNETIRELLADEQKRLTLAEAGRAKVMQHHTWDCRVQEILAQNRFLL